MPCSQRIDVANPPTSLLANNGLRSSEASTGQQSPHYWHLHSQQRPLLLFVESSSPRAWAVPMLELLGVDFGRGALGPHAISSQHLNNIRNTYIHQRNRRQEDILRTVTQSGITREYRCNRSGATNGRRPEAAVHAIHSEALCVTS